MAKKKWSLLSHTYVTHYLANLDKERYARNKKYPAFDFKISPVSKGWAIFYRSKK